MKTATRQLSVRLSVILAAVLTVFLLIGGPADAEGPPRPATEHVVSSGETLWSIASAEVAEGEDVRNLIAEIKETSGLATSTLHPGQILLIPGG
ncbi:MAG: LysM peptidoglycan-binding domain-containing protein [Acidimicrobiia bacterium]